MKLGVVLLVFVLASVLIAREVSRDWKNGQTHPVFSLNAIEGIEWVYRDVGATLQTELIGSEKPIRAAVLPHHTLPSKELNTFWATITEGQAPSVIVVLGPNHENAGTSEIQVTEGVWTSPEGSVSTDDNLVAALLRSGLAGNESNSFINEHAIGTHIPYIAHWLPNTPILPVIAKSQANADDARLLEAWMAEHLPDDALVVASVDFSHYLDQETTAAMDQETIAFIEDRDYEHIASLHSDHLDAPFAMIAYLLWNDRHDWRADLAWHSSSHIILADSAVPGTSYLLYVSLDD